ncbi:MAG: MBL fold metallo-hydrolase [Phycisphaeraceae bacterium]|nr:MBL fold metallo-hydrolase [Phycisphaerae bacterium]MBX3393576.1 MBL fold metallo-hydrolase [Phycisphaeraceae bacterium]
MTSPPHHPLQPAAIRFRWTLLRAGTFRLDGGSMFGLIPRTVWTRAVTPDDRGRITVEHNCLLLEREGDGPGPGLVLIETGSGDKLDAKSKDIFAMQERSILDALHAADASPGDIGAVVVSHLHFDHAGGLTRLCRPGETPDWTPQSPSQGPPVKLTFPNALVHTQRREWIDAVENHSVMTRTYFRDHLDPIRERVILADSPRPFPVGYIPGRDELPSTPVHNRIWPVPQAPGIGLILTPGHTWGQQAVVFTDTSDRTIVFVPDVMPTAAHVGAAYSLGYDVEPYTSMVSRHWLLRAAEEHGWVLVLDHEPGNPVRRVRSNDRGWFDLVEDQA